MSILKRIALGAGLTLLGLLVIPKSDRANAAELNEEDFVPLATQGFMTAVDGAHPEGSQRNSYIWSMQWWQGKLYAGTVRDAICLFGEGGTVPNPDYEQICPPAGTLTPDQRSEIWEYTPGGEDGAHGTWQRVFQSPLLLNGLTQTPREVGYRKMVTCDAGGPENLYVATYGAGGRILYTPDGSNFQQASLVGLNLVTDLNYRTMVCWKGRLWISPSGTFFATGLPPEPLDFEADVAFRKVLLANRNPTSPISPWLPFVNVADNPIVGDPNNLGIWSMGVFGDALYLGVTNRTTGFQIWKADGSTCQEPPRLCLLSWQKIIVDGGGLPVPPDTTSNNARVFTLIEFNGHLYWIAGETAPTKFGPGEMGRIGPDGRWDLIVGAPRDASTMAAYPNFNCHQEGDLCLPLSGKGPSFGPTPFTRGSALYIWQIQSHEGVLYVGTAENQGLSTPFRPGAGLDLWRSSNGIDWTLVSDDGFGNPFNYGVRNMASSPFGLFVGTANPFTLEDGSNGGTGGAEVWLGIGDQ